ncbi:hypothetical protein [Anaerotruncus colihominis]|uniref:hypothetical protein n=1 Tax=Anaerotruncus colihominis TaxID=169435 RepID=UPI0013A668C8|nr:hypothetical protein [Anaerotruncus colihominis]
MQHSNVSPLTKFQRPGDLEANRLAQRPLYFHYPPCHTDATQSLIDTILLLQQNKGG